MPRKKKPKNPRISFIEAITRLKKAGLKADSTAKPTHRQLDEIEDLGQRIEKLLKLVKNFKSKPDTMVFFVMYDIENNKVRTQIAKYLIKKGCVRIQKSVYLAELKRKQYKEIHKTIKEVQGIYENNDSILFVPVQHTILSSMKILGQQIDFDFIQENKNTHFF
ncbi:MAG: CRISPR-associated endonuclease Cas2 [Bacteroidota bacterium]|nr:CRISPR-associated endonuclease Cas2 [Bacteroidota bacterium]